MATIKDSLELNTLRVIMSKFLLKELGDRDGQYVWKQLTEEGGDFVAFVTADSEDSYPDSGEQDGYWYELVEEGLDLLSIMGYTKMAVDKFTFSTRTEVKAAGTIPHSLGEIPKMVMLLSSVVGRQDSNYIFAFYMPISGYSYNLNGARSVQYQGSYSVSIETFNATTSGVNKSSTGSYFEAGVEYTLITMA